MKKLLVVALTLIFVMTSLALALAEKVEISYWHISLEPTAILKDADLVKNFMAENPNIKVVVQEVPAVYMEEKTLLAIVSGAMPNVERDFLGRLAAWAHKDVLESLDGTLSPADLEDFIPGVLDVFRVEGKLIGYPADFVLQNYVVNKTILDRAGAVTPDGSWTVDELMVAAEKVKALGDPDIWPTVLFAKDEQGDYWTLMYFQMWGAKLWTDKDYTKTTLNSEAGIEALEWMVWLDNNEYTPGGAPGRHAGEQMRDFDAGKIAFCGSAARVGTLAYRQKMLEGGQVDELQDIQMVATPHVEGIPTAGLYFFPHGVSVFEEENKEKREAAIKLSQYLTSPEACKVYALGECMFAARKSVDPWPDEPPFQKTTQMMSEYGVADLGISSPFYLECRHLLFPELQHAYLGSKTPKQALDDFAKGVAELWK